MDSEYIINDLKKYLSECLDIRLENIKNDSSIIGELGAYSIVLVGLFAYIKDTYKIILDEQIILKSVAEKIFLKLDYKS